LLIVTLGLIRMRLADPRFTAAALALGHPVILWQAVTGWVRCQIRPESRSRERRPIGREQEERSHLTRWDSASIDLRVLQPAWLPRRIRVPICRGCDLVFQYVHNLALNVAAPEEKTHRSRFSIDHRFLCRSL